MGESAEPRPDLAEYHPVEDRAYARQMEGRIKATAELIRPTPMAISPLSVEALVERASDLGADPGDGETRASLAAELARPERRSPGHRAVTSPAGAVLVSSTRSAAARSHRPGSVRRGPAPGVGLLGPGCNRRPRTYSMP